MAHERDRDRRRPPAPFELPILESEPNPDRLRRERPSPVPCEPLDRRPRPSRGGLRAHARPAA
jgi:hypothetical protein